MEEGNSAKLSTGGDRKETWLRAVPPPCNRSQVSYPCIFTADQSSLLQWRLEMLQVRMVSTHRVPIVSPDSRWIHGGAAGHRSCGAQHQALHRGWVRPRQGIEQYQHHQCFKLLSIKGDSILTSFSNYLMGDDPQFDVCCSLPVALELVEVANFLLKSDADPNSDLLRSTLNQR